MSSASSLGLYPIISDGDYYTDVNGYEIPQNIRHRFRSTITSELLADKDKVERDKRHIEYIEREKRTPIYRRSQTTMEISNPDYVKISNDLRNTVCCGNPVKRGSHSKTIHNEAVFKQHFQNEKQANLHGRKKDWLGRWTEANIIRDRLYKNIAEAQKKATK